MNMRTIAALLLLFALLTTAHAESPNGAFCTGEQIDTLAVGFPQPTIYRGQIGVIAAAVRNVPDPSLGLATCFATDITVKLVFPDGAVFVLASGIRLAPNESQLVFGTIDVDLVTTDTATFFVVVDGLAEGRYALHSERTVTFVIAPTASAATNVRRKRWKMRDRC